MTITAKLSYLTTQEERAYYFMDKVPEGQSARNVRGDRHKVSIENARELAEPVTLEREGVELVPWDRDPQNEQDAKGVIQTFYPQVEALVKKYTGASRVDAFDHNVRTSDKDQTGNKNIQAPVRLVHNDYTESSGPQRVRDLFPKEADSLLLKRFSIINVWKPIRVPALKEPLAICDARTIQKREMIPTDLRYTNRTGEIYSFRYSPDHRWLYFPEMQTDEAILLKCYDSSSSGARFTAHTAVDDPNSPESAPHRQSIEVRTLAFF